MLKHSMPIHAPMDCIYPGPHLTADGTLDDRVWFCIPFRLDPDEYTVTYLVFPYGGSDSEIQEITTEAQGSWIS